MSLNVSHESELYQEAVAAYRNGRPHQAHQLLRQLVTENPHHEKAWLGLSQVAVTNEEKFVALEAAVALNPAHEKAAARLKQLSLAQDDHLALGKVYEALGQPAKAIKAFQYAAKQSPSSADRHIARQHLNDLLAIAETQKQGIVAEKERRPLTITHDTTTLLRLAAGPVIVYFLLVFIHSGLNPLHLPFFFYLNGLLVIFGSLLVTGIANTPNHPIWQKVIGPAGLHSNFTRFAITLFGLMLIILPFGIVLIVSVNQLLVYQQTLSAAVH